MDGYRVALTVRRGVTSTYTYRPFGPNTLFSHKRAWISSTEYHAIPFTGHTYKDDTSQAVKAVKKGQDSCVTPRDHETYVCSWNVGILCDLCLAVNAGL